MIRSVVKSAARTLEVFELFAERQAPLSVNEVGAALGFPQSSTSALLRSLAALGYLNHDLDTRRYFPTQRMALLGNWIELDSGVLALLEQLRRATGETVLLGQRNGLDVQYIDVLVSDAELRLHLKPGTRRPLVRTATGRVLLAQLSDAEVLRILTRSNALAAPGARTERAELMQAIARVRTTGFAMTDGHMTSGAGVIATLMPALPRQPPMSVGIGAPIARLRASAAAIRTELARSLILLRPARSATRAPPADLGASAVRAHRSTRRVRQRAVFSYPRNAERSTR